jgi:hypothetical protein
MTSEGAMKVPSPDRSRASSSSRTTPTGPTSGPSAGRPRSASTRPRCAFGTPEGHHVGTVDRVDDDLRPRTNKDDGPAGLSFHPDSRTRAQRRPFSSFREPGFRFLHVLET